MALAWLSERPPRGLADAIASGACMAAFAIMLAEFVLSGRSRALSRQVGMDAMMRLHQFMGRMAVALVVIHPLFYTAAFAPPGHGTGRAK
jgi:predicted ferric reductase